MTKMNPRKIKGFGGCKSDTLEHLHIPVPIRWDSDGRTNRTTHSGVLCLDDNPSSSEIPVIPVQGRIPTATGVWCVSGSLVGSTHRLTENPLSQNWQHNLNLYLQLRFPEKYRWGVSKREGVCVKLPYLESDGNLNLPSSTTECILSSRMHKGLHSGTWEYVFCAGRVVQVLSK